MSELLAVILAAGGSSRLGRPKQLVELGGERLLERAVRVAREAGCQPLVILGALAVEIEAACDLTECEVLLNLKWRDGMAGSIRIGIERAVEKGSEAAILMTCDQPAVTAEHLRRLAGSGVVVASLYGGRRGVPAYFPSSSFGMLCKLKGDMGARELLSDARTVELRGGELDVDTEALVRLAEERFG